MLGKPWSSGPGGRNAEGGWLWADEALKEKFEELAKGEPEAAAAEAVLVGERMVSDSSSSCTSAILGERTELKPPKGPEPPGKVDSAMVKGSGGFVVC